MNRRQKFIIYAITIFALYFFIAEIRYNIIQVITPPKPSSTPTVVNPGRPITPVVYMNPDVNRDLFWREDLEFMRDKILATHPLFDRKPHINIPRYDENARADRRATFVNDFEQLIYQIPDLNDAGIVFEAQRIIASLGDYHSKLYMHSGEQLFFPFILTGFEENQYIYLARYRHRKTLGKRITAINDINIFDVLNRIAPYISADTGNTHHLMSGDYMLSSAELLAHVGVIDDPESANFTLTDENGESTTMFVKSVPLLIYTTPWAGWVSVVENPTRYVDKWPQLKYYYEYWDDDNTLYWRHRSCIEMNSRPMNKFYDSIIESIKQTPPDKIIIDLRDNGGGYLYNFDSFAVRLITLTSQNSTPIYVIVDHSTRSHAVSIATRLKNLSTRVTIVGTPTGESPIFFYDPAGFVMPHSKLPFDCSRDYINNTRNRNFNSNTLTPDVYIEDSFEDYINQYDRIIETIKTF